MDVNITYSGYNGTNGNKGHEFITVHGSTPEAMTMKAFGYRSGYATVNYSWTGKDNCEQNTDGNGMFVQTLRENDISLVGTIPPNVQNLEIHLKSSSDLDIQLYSQDGTAIVSWQPTGLLSGPIKQSILYNDMNITWSGYNGTNGKQGHEYITVTPKTAEVLVMKVFGYEAGEANVTYSWGETNITSPEDMYTKDVKNYIFGHSLINHEHAQNQPASNELGVPHWLYHLAQADGNTYAVDGQYGFMPTHANTLPPESQWHFNDVPHVWDSESSISFADAGFTTVMLTPANFIQWEPVNGQPYAWDGDTRTPVEVTLEVIDWIASQVPNADIIIYQNWPDMGSYAESFPPTPIKFSEYNTYTQGAWLTWWDAYILALKTARPNINIRMIDVGTILSKVLTNTSANQILPSQLYEDNAPHGRPTLYFLSALITYMGMYANLAPQNFSIPNTINPIITNNYQSIVNYIWQELGNE
ncbi:MAG: Unknown protein [uncultured Sulfurovum sp.]|uniref:Uncharacterized protein n=1 Tax=uncultured Sulfurovum sp. TaxID=269237 RepID=A0A6S6S1L2_9BACT|nr:MAG: Unknown protein [uncultured Sulfurovum sp.]